jgi:hypothetical protein
MRHWRGDTVFVTVSVLVLVTICGGLFSAASSFLCAAATSWFALYAITPAPANDLRLSGKVLKNVLVSPAQPHP